MPNLRTLESKKSDPRNRFWAEIAHALRNWRPIGRSHRESELLADWRFEREEWEALLALRPEQHTLRVFRAMKLGFAGLALSSIVPLYTYLAPTFAPRRSLAFIGPQLPAYSWSDVALYSGLALAGFLVAGLVYRVVDRYALWGSSVRVRVYPFGLALNSHLMRWDGPGERMEVEALKQHPHGLVFSLKHPSRLDPMRVAVFRVVTLAPDRETRDQILERLRASRGAELPDLPDASRPQVA